MNTRKFTSKTNRKSVDELEKQLINFNIEFYSALKILKENPFPISAQDQKYIETLQKKIKIVNTTLQRKLEHNQRQRNSPEANA